MGGTSDQIERHIQETRNDLGDNFKELQEKVRTAVDWRAQFEEHPMTMMALAFGGGILLSALLPFRPSASGRSSASSANTSSSDRHTSDLPSKSRNEYNDKTSSPLETWDAVKGALVGVATTKLSGFIEDVLPGFTQEFTKAQGGRNSVRSDPPNPGQSTRQKSTAAGAD
jgi:hypothetical protein